MENLTYCQPGLVIKRGGSEATVSQVKELQKNLRQLGYLQKGIDGNFGRKSELAVKALQYDLLHNHGKSTQLDGEASVSILEYNRGRITQVTGQVTQDLAGCIADMVNDSSFPLLPKTENPKSANSEIITGMKALTSSSVPIPFIMGILRQESGLKHYNEPKPNDEDTFITLGTDTNSSERYIITSRGYGAGQYTLFHHPPRQDEVNDFMLDVQKNLHKAMVELKEKFDIFVNGNTSGTRADDRITEHGIIPLRTCKYGIEDSRYLHDCRNCMINAGQSNIHEGSTPIYEGSHVTFLPTQYYKKASYSSVPIRKNLDCDWPYAIRRYNGAGINSYHYQARVLKNVLRL